VVKGDAADALRAFYFCEWSGGGRNDDHAEVDMSDRRVSRRHFLGNAAAAGAAGILWASGSSSAAGADATGSGKDAALRWGIIGTGTRGTFTHIPVLKEAPE